MNTRASINKNVRTSVVVIFLSLVQACATTTAPTQTIKASGADPFEVAAVADTAYKRGDWNSAERHYGELSRAVPQDSYAWMRLGNVRMQLSNFSGAISAYQEALSRDKELAKAHYNIATAYLLMARASLSSVQQLLPEEDGGFKLASEKLSYFDFLVYEPVVESKSPGENLISSGAE